MNRNPRDIQRYNASERMNHWAVAICFILLAMSGLAFFHPAFFPLTALFGGGPWTRILHPYIGVVMAVLFMIMAARFACANVIRERDIEWLKQAPQMLSDEHHVMPEQDKYNGGQKVLFWGLVVGMLLITVTGVLMWRAWWNLPVTVVRGAALVHAIAAVWMIALIIMHVYAAIWTKGTIRAMVRGTVTRAWARYHHPLWFRRMTGGKD